MKLTIIIKLKRKSGLHKTVSSLIIYMKNFSILIGSAIFSKYSAKKWNTVQKKKYSANFIDYLGFLIGLKYETITKIANKYINF
jgi:hypothetical protein